MGCYKSTYHSSSTKYANYQITFTGTQLQLYAAKTAASGKANIYVDSVLTKTIDLYSAWTLEQQLYSDTGALKNGKHLVKVVVNGTKNASSSGYRVECDKLVLKK